MLNTLLQAKSDKIFVVDFNKEWPNKSIFIGIGFTSDVVIIGQRGWDEAKSKFLFSSQDLISGRFLGLEVVSQNEVIVFCDPMVQDSIFYWECNATGNLVVSNSYLYLLKYLADNNYNIVVNDAIFSGFKLFSGSSLASQLFQYDTPVNNISILKRGQLISVKRTVHSFNYNFLPLNLNLSCNYFESILAFINNYRGCYNELESNHLCGFQCDLSGGRDSRINFGILAASLNKTSNLNIHSRKKKKEEFLLAKKVAESKGWSLSSKKCKSLINREFRIPNNFELVINWLFGSVGLYLPFYFGGGRFNSQWIKIHGGNFVADYFAKFTPSENITRIRNGLQNIKIKDVHIEKLVYGFENYFESHDLDLNQRSSMQHHYIDFRSRFHYGRNWTVSYYAPMLTPLIDQYLFHAFHNCKGNVSDFYSDLFLAVDPSLLNEPFDNPNKNIPIEKLYSSVFWEKNSNDFSINPTNYKVYGDFSGYSQPYVYEPPNLYQETHMSINEIILVLYDELSPFALSSGHFSRDEISRGRNELFTSKKLSHDARLASMILQTGIIYFIVN